jgi:hypothetical protein
MTEAGLNRARQIAMLHCKADFPKKPVGIFMRMH